MTSVPTRMAAVAVTVAIVSQFLNAYAPVTVAEFPTTFVVQQAGALVSSFAGVWTGVGNGMHLAVAQRTDSSIFGVIPAGRFEGVLRLAVDATDPAGPLIRGRHIAARGDLSEQTTTLRLVDNELQATFGAAAPLRFVRTAAIGNALAHVAIIGHRGLSLDDRSLMNSFRAFDNAFSFGCTGVEFDVTVPYLKTGSERTPQPDKLAVLHPPEVWSEVTGFDSVAASETASAPHVDQVLERAGRSGIRIAYVDMKLRWLYPKRTTSAAAAVSRLKGMAESFLAAHPDAMVLLGAERSGDSETADILANSLTQSAGVGWALEFTRGSDESRFRAYASGAAGGSPPTVLSWSLLRIKGAGQGILGWVLRDLSDDAEPFYRSLRQPSVFWTADSEDQFRAALNAARRLGTADFRERRTAIITPYPHRLAYFLATTPW